MLWIGEHIALPQTQCFPAKTVKELIHLAVPIYVAVDLRYPIVRVMADGQLLESVSKIAAMPEIAIAKDG